MRLDECKNVVAREKGYPNWKEMYDWIARENQIPAVVAQLIEAATEEAVCRFYCDNYNEPSEHFAAKYWRMGYKKAMMDKNETR